MESVMKIRKSPEQIIRYDTGRDPYVMWGKAKIPIEAFNRETVRFVDWEREYWHGMDCTRDLVIHILPGCDRCVLGKVSA